MKGKIISALLVALLCLGMFAAFPVHANPGPTMSILNPDDTHDLTHVNPAYWTASKTYDTKKDGTPAGPGDIVFHTDTRKGDKFYVRVRLDDVSDLYTWQVVVTFDPTKINCVDAFIAPGSIFDFDVDAGPEFGADYVMMGSSKKGAVPGTSGSGDLVWVVFEVADVPGYGEWLSCSISIKTTGTPKTFLQDSAGNFISFTSNNGYYEIFWTPPEKHPYYVVVPSEYKAKTLGEDVFINITVRDVDPAWEIVGFQFILRFNATLLEPVELINGTFMEQFVNDGESIFYTEAHDYIGNPALPPGYNAWMVAVIIIPAPGPEWKPPFPEGEGTLATLKFKAIYETTSPTEAWTDLSFTVLQAGPGKYIQNYAINQYQETISLGPCQGGNYRAPIKVLGLAIDLYSQYPYPYGGQGPVWGTPSDSFAPQQQVELYAKVTYNEDPVQQKLVAFEVRHGEFYIYREAKTDDNGIAHVSFRIPWPCDNPAERVLGEWNAIATVEVAEQVKNDTMPFKVYWPVEVVSVEPKATQFVKRKPATNDNLEFTMTYRTYHMQSVSVVLTVTIYDELGFVIGYDVLTTTISSPAYCTFGVATWNISVSMPSNAVVGKATVYGNAFSDLPFNGGTAYCPEKTNTVDFYIVKGS